MASPYGASQSHSDTPHLVWLLCKSNQPDAETSTGHHNTYNKVHAYSGIRTHNPSKKPRGHWDRLYIHIYMCVCVCVRARACTSKLQMFILDNSFLWLATIPWSIGWRYDLVFERRNVTFIFGQISSICAGWPWVLSITSKILCETLLSWQCSILEMKQFNFKPW